MDTLYIAGLHFPPHFGPLNHKSLNPNSDREWAIIVNDCENRELNKRREYTRCLQRTIITEKTQGLIIPLVSDQSWTPLPPGDRSRFPAIVFHWNQRCNHPIHCTLWKYLNLYCMVYTTRANFLSDISQFERRIANFIHASLNFTQWPTLDSTHDGGDNGTVGTSRYREESVLWIHSENLLDAKKFLSSWLFGVIPCRNWLFGSSRKFWNTN
jgi:hypothetical protein